MAPKESSKKRGESSRRRHEGTDEDDSTDVTKMLGGMDRDELLKFKAQLDKQLAHIGTPSHTSNGRRGSSSSKNQGRSSEKSTSKSINELSLGGDKEEDEKEDDTVSEEEDEEENEDYDVTFCRLPKKEKDQVFMVQGGEVHLDENGQTWQTALGHAVKYFCTEIDKDWKKVDESSKKRLVRHMERRFGKGVFGSDLLKRAGRNFNHWKDWLRRSDKKIAPNHVKDPVWERFLANKKIPRHQQKKAAGARKVEDIGKTGRRGHAGIAADYFRDWGAYPSAKTMAAIKKNLPYKVYRESLIAEGKIPGNFKAIDFLGKKGDRKNKQRRKQIKTAKSKAQGDQQGDQREEEVDVDLEAEDAHEVEEGGNIEMVDGGEQEVDGVDDTGVEHVGDGVEAAMELDCNADLSPEAEVDAFYDALVEKGLEGVRSVEEMIVTKRKDVEEATRRSDNASTSRKKGKKSKNRGVGRNLSPAFVDGAVQRNIAQYKSLQKEKRA